MNNFSPTWTNNPDRSCTYTSKFKLLFLIYRVSTVMGVPPIALLLSRSMGRSRNKLIGKYKKRLLIVSSLKETICYFVVIFRILIYERKFSSVSFDDTQVGVSF